MRCRWLLHSGIQSQHNTNWSKIGLKWTIRENELVRPPPIFWYDEEQKKMFVTTRPQRVLLSNMFVAERCVACWFKNWFTMLQIWTVVVRGNVAIGCRYVDGDHDPNYVNISKPIFPWPSLRSGLLKMDFCFGKSEAKNRRHPRDHHFPAIASNQFYFPTNLFRMTRVELSG